MSQEDPRLDPETEGKAPDHAGPADAPRKKRGFWGWLTGRSDEAAAPAEPGSESQAAAPEAPAAETAQTSEAAATPPEPGASLAGTPPRSEAAADVPASAAPVKADTPSAPEGPEFSEPGASAAPEPPAADDIPLAAPDATPQHEPEPTEPEPPSPAVAREADSAPATARTPEAPPPPAPTASEVLSPERAAPAAAEAAPAAAADITPTAASGGRPATDAAPARKGFWARLATGLARTASSLGQGITDLVAKRKLDAETLEELEDVLIRADLGVETAGRIVEAVGKGRHDKMISPEEVKALIAAEVERILTPVATPLVVDATRRPFVVLMVGVNGSGKTTTIGKLAAQWRQEGKKVVLAAGDTFRAAAIDQLKVWGQRTGTKVIAREPGADAAGVAHEALVEARADGADILLIDTAGRLQNRTELMAELEKIVRVVKKLEPSAPHAVLLVLDATVGQNALSQVEAFTRIAGVTGLVMTKLDGTARGGILVAIAAKHRLPVHLIGVGEAADDLQPFTARDFARAIAGLT